MPIKLGSENIGAFFLGTEPIAKLMLGTELVWQGVDPPGNVTFDTVGTHSFIVPRFATQLVVEVWGGGAGGHSNGGGGSAGGSSSFLSQSANGAPAPIPVFDGSAPGGTASGGDINISGGAGVQKYSHTSGGKGGNAPNGGTGGAGGESYGAGQNGNAPGGGGGPGGGFDSWGGGAGGYSKKTYTGNQITKGQQISLIVGAGGVRSDYGAGASGAGARGEVRISWS